MKILISGASGLIGTSLTKHLEQQGHHVYLLHRNRKSGRFFWQPELGIIHIDDSIQLDAVINLNGVNIGDKPWSKQRKKDIIDSRVQSTELLAKTMVSRIDPPSVFINASAIGFYGDTADTITNESSPAGHNFLTNIVQQWEQAAAPIANSTIRSVFIRSGVVLSKQGGALKKMLLPFKLGLGGRVGSGQQYMSWISMSDEIRAIEFILNQPEISGPVNLTAPNPVTNTEFTQALGHVLNRPTPFPLPAFIVKALFGEMGKLLLLGSNRVIPSVLEAKGFKFKHKDIRTALMDEIYH